TGLILPLGDWVLRQACEDAARFDDDICVAVNVSPMQFRSGDIIESVDRALEETRLSPSRLQIEVTESLLLDETTDVAEMLSALDDRGVTLALDDFGTGYSSLSYLVGYPFKKLKIDRSFITGLPEASTKLAILRAIARLGDELGLTTTMEGVETLDQLDIAQDERCSEVQGFYFARPVPYADLRDTVNVAEALAMEMRSVPKLTV
ncbi:MAG: EAL domain-containing protein, partial [Pseudomonadota bacterium]